MVVERPRDPAAGAAPPRLLDVTVHRGSFELRCSRWESTPGLTVIIGLNGAGKSTLLQLLNGSIRPDSGSVASARDVLLPQSARLEGRWSVREFLTYIAFLRGVPRGDRESQVSSAVELLELAEYATKPVGALSGGWKQRVLIAQCLVGDFNELLFDEPTSSLDVSAARNVWTSIRSLSARYPCTVATHEASASIEFADRILPIQNGKVLDPLDGMAIRKDFANSDQSAEAFLLELMTP